MNRYNLQEGIGEGTFGTVFRATRKDDGNEVVRTDRSRIAAAAAAAFPLPQHTFSFSFCVNI